MSFRDMVEFDNTNIFLNLNEFAESRNIKYNDTLYENISVVMTGLKEQDRQQSTSDHAQGMYLVTSVLHCKISDLDGIQPKKGSRIKISDADDTTYYNDYYIASSVCEIGMLRLELEAIDE